MYFQFLCPQGHLLQGAVQQIGQPCRCPYCGVEFRIPAMQSAPMFAAPAPGIAPGIGPAMPAGMPSPMAPGVTPAVVPGHVPGMATAAAYPPGYHPPGATVAHLPQPAEAPAESGLPNFAGIDTPEEPAEGVDVLGTAEDDPNRIVHIICPEGHELPTPMSMIGQDAMCPHCSSLFRLRYEDTKEAQEEAERMREFKERQFGEKALRWAIVAAVLVGISLVGMIAILVLK